MMKSTCHLTCCHLAAPPPNCQRQTASISPRTAKNDNQKTTNESSDKNQANRTENPTHCTQSVRWNDITAKIYMCVNHCTETDISCTRKQPNSDGRIGWLSDIETAAAVAVRKGMLENRFIHQNRCGCYLLVYIGSRRSHILGGEDKDYL